MARRSINGLDNQGSLPDSPNPVWDFNTGNHKKLTLNNFNTASLNLINAPNNSEGILHFIQGNNGNKSLILPGNSPNGLTFSTQAGQRDLLTFIKDGDGFIVWSFANYGTVTINPGNPGGGVSGSTATSSFAMSVIPYSSADYIKALAGIEAWHNDSSYIDYPTQGGNQQAQDVYWRSGLSWNILEPTQGNYVWTTFDQKMNDAISKGQKMGFNIMTLHPGDTFFGTSMSGYDEKSGTTRSSWSCYPAYVHTSMQNAGAGQRDWVSTLNGTNNWIPNWNNETFLSRAEALLNALAAHCNTTYATDNRGISRLS